jgi:hypothetical protein
MGIRSDLESAVRRAETKKQVSRLLASLPVDDQRSILLDLVAEDGLPGSIGNGATRPKAAAEAPAVTKPVKEQSRTDALLAALGEHPGMPISDLAAAVYGESNKQNKANTRSLIAALYKQRRVKRVRPGEWKVVSTG